MTDDIVACLLAVAPHSVTPTAPPIETLRRAERLAVAPRVASRLERDPTVMDWNAEASARAALLAHGARQVVQVLDDAGVPALLMKGAALAALGVGELGDRHSDDVDALVPAGRREEAEAALERAGYVRAEAVTRPAVDGRAVAAQEVRAGDHAAPSLVSPTGVHVDLHDRVPDARLDRIEAFEPHVVQVGATDVRTPSPPALLAQLCDHVVVHHQARPSYLARHVADLVSLEARFGEGIWEQARPLCSPQAWHISRALLRLARSQPALASVALVPSERARIAVELAWETWDVAGRARRDLVRDPSRIARKLVPARAYVAASYGVTADDPRLPFLYVHRLVTFRWLTRPFYG